MQKLTDHKFYFESSNKRKILNELLESSHPSINIFQLNIFFTRKMFKCISNIMKHLNLTELLSVPLLLVWKNIIFVLSYVTGYTSAMQQVYTGL